MVISRPAAAPASVPGAICDWGPAGLTWERWARGCATAPFDALRANYAAAVRSGAVAPSLLAAGRFERHVARLETLLLGPWARAR